MRGKAPEHEQKQTSRNNGVALRARVGKEEPAYIWLSVQSGHIETTVHSPQRYRKERKGKKNVSRKGGTEQCAAGAYSYLYVRLVSRHAATVLANGVADAIKCTLHSAGVTLKRRPLYGLSIVICQTGLSGLKNVPGCI